MRCPSCLTELQNSVESCGNCGFNLASLDKKFGTVPKNFRYLTDTIPYFEEREQRLLEKNLLEIERHFPGLYLSIMTMPVFHLFKPREYLFWLMNRCHFGPLDCRLERSFSVVLFFDSTSKTVLLTTGYGLQDTLPEESLDRILKLGLPYFKKERFFTGTQVILTEIKRHLKKYCTTGLAPTAPELKTKTAATDELKPVEDLF